MKKVVLISCVKKKKALAPGQTVAAKDLYESPMFRMAWQYAVNMKPDRIYILSAKHGLVAPDKKIGTYNQTLNDASVSERKRWSAEVLSALCREGLDLNRDQFVILAGKNYSQYLLPSLKHYSLPYQENGCSGMGYILQFLKHETGK